MFKNMSPKAIALGGITFGGLGMIGIGVEVTKAVTFEIQKARAATTTALAELDQAKAQIQIAIAEMEKARAARLDAENKLLAAIEARNGTMIAAQYMAQGQRDAAVTAGESLVIATGVDRHVDNAMYDSFAGPLFAEPSKTINALNRQIVRLKHEAMTGIDSNTRRLISEDQRADRMAQAKILEEQVSIESDTAAKNMGDVMNVVMKGVSGVMGGMEAFYPTGASRVPTDRRILQEP